MKSIYRTAVGEQAIRRWCHDQLSGWPVPHERRTLTANGTDTHVVVAGTGALTVVFVPGTNFNAATSLPLATALSDRYRVVLVDVPGQPGLSTGDRGVAGGRLAWYGTWLAELVEKVSTGPVVTLGHSFGGAIALSSSPPRLAGRVLVSTGGLCSLRLTPAVLLAATAWAAFPRPENSARLLRTMLSPGHLPRQVLVEWMTLVAQHSRSSRAPGLAPTPTDSAPVLAATGDHDVFLPPKRLGPAAQDKLGIELSVVMDAGHLVVEEEPGRIAGLVSQVIDQTPTRG